VVPGLLQTCNSEVPEQPNMPPGRYASARIVVVPLTRVVANVLYGYVPSVCGLTDATLEFDEVKTT
jgi:hypothetical protein